MKKTYLNFKTLLLLILVGFAFSSCSSDDDSMLDQDDNTGGKDMVANIAFESGDKIDFGYTFPNMNLTKPTITHEKGSNRSVLTISGIMGIYGISIIGVINDKKGNYSYREDFDEDGDETGVMIWLHTMKGDDMESFMPFKMSDETMGSAKVNITSLTKNHIKATFSATLYSQKSGEKVIIKDGKINSGLYRNEVAPE